MKDDCTVSAARRAVVLLVWLAALVGALAVAVRASYTADLSAFLPAAPDPQQRALIQQLQSGVASRTLLVAIEGGSAAARAQASIALARALRAGPLFEQVANGDDAANAAMAEWVFGHRYLLSPAVTPQRYTEAGLREALDDTLSLLGTPAGARLKPLLARDPTGEAMRIAEALWNGRHNLGFLIALSLNLSLFPINGAGEGFADRKVKTRCMQTDAMERSVCRCECTAKYTIDRCYNRPDGG